MKEERGFFNSKSPDGGGCLALLVLVFVLYTMYHMNDLIDGLDKFFLR